MGGGSSGCCRVGIWRDALLTSFMAKNMKEGSTFLAALFDPLTKSFKTSLKNPAKAETQKLASPALMSSSVKVVFY